jgi:hypothetical protein
MLKTVASGMRKTARIVPARSDTAITILVGLPSGSRMAARVRSACALALCTMVLTLAALRVGPALGPMR